MAQLFGPPEPKSVRAWPLETIDPTSPRDQSTTRRTASSKSGFAFRRRYLPSGSANTVPAACPAPDIIEHTHRDTAGRQAGEPAAV